MNCSTDQTKNLAEALEVEIVFIIVLIIGGGVMLRWAFGEFNDESIPPSNHLVHIII